MNASGVVFLAALLDVFFVIAICMKYKIIPLRLTFIPNNGIVLGAIFLFLMFLIERFYSEKRIKKLSEKYAKRSLSGLANVLLIAALIVIPLVAVIILRWKG
jgi:hypothetical protein